MRKVGTVIDVEEDESRDSETCRNVEEETRTCFGGMIFRCIGSRQRLVGIALVRLTQMDGASLVGDGHDVETASKGQRV